jgi:hypothetical protein
MYDLLTITEWIHNLYRSGIASANGSPVDPSRMWIEQYAYTISFGSFNGVSGVANAQLQINANADFVCTKISYFGALSTAQTVNTQPIIQARMILTDTGSARPLFNSATALENFASRGDMQRPLPYPRWFAANTTISAQATAFGTAAETFTVFDLTFEGMSIRTFSQGMSL